MRLRTLLVAAAFAVAAPLQAQIMNDFHADLNDVQKKIIDLANAMPEASLDYTPGPGVRTVREVFMHIASDNYLLPVYMGKPAPASTGITADYNTAVTYEKKKMTKAEMIAALTASFTHVHQGLALTTEANLGEKIKMFGGPEFSRGRAAILLVTHLHEHLGQAIAYARVNKVVPPWSK